MNLSKEQLSALERMTNTVSAHYDNFKKLFGTLKETKDKLMVEMGTTNQTTNEMRKLLTPEQMAKFLLLSDKVKLKQEFDMFIN